VKFPVVDSDDALLPSQYHPEFDKNIKRVGADGEDTSDLIVLRPSLKGASVVIWTTTPWTIPGNRAVAYSPRIQYSLYEVTSAENDFGPRPGEKLIFAEALAEEAFTKAKLNFKR